MFGWDDKANTVLIQNTTNLYNNTGTKLLIILHYIDVPLLANLNPFEFSFLQYVIYSRQFHSHSLVMYILEDSAIIAAVQTHDLGGTVNMLQIPEYRS